MRTENTIYGGEMSAHHYFRDFAYCDSGMIPWLLVAELISIKNKTLSALVDERMKSWPLPRKLRPKQFLPVVSDDSLFQMTLQRLTGLPEL